MRLERSAAAFVAALFACRSAESGNSTLLFLGRSPAATLGGLSWAPDPEHSRIVAFDRRLHIAKRFTSPRLATPMAVAALGTTLVVTERSGEGVMFDSAGRVVREWPSPYVASLYGAGGRRLVAVRSPYYVPQFAPEADTAALIRTLDTLGRPVGRLGNAMIPEVPFLADVVNAGAVAVGDDGSVYFAPLVRDEIRKYSQDGALRWTVKRGLFANETEPEFLSRGKAVDVRKALVNIAIVLGSDRRLYVLGADDSAATRLRLDVLDAASGAILATRHLGPTETAVAVGDQGEIATFSAESLLADPSVAPASAREPFAPAFALPDLQGDTVTLARFARTVTLVNFWASWCGPCREEFPDMAKLYREFDRKDFEIAAVSDDVDRGKMLAFIREFQPPFPVLVGRGRMKQLYHYRGLPYSVLLDRHGRVIERIFGFGGPTEFQKLRETIALEVRAP